MSPLASQREAGIIRTVYVNISTTDAQSQGVVSKSSTDILTMELRMLLST